MLIRDENTLDGKSGTPEETHAYLSSFLLSAAVGVSAFRRRRQRRE